MDKRGRNKKVTLLATRGNTRITGKKNVAMKRTIEGLCEKNKNMDFLAGSTDNMQLNNDITTKINNKEKETLETKKDKQVSDAGE